MPSIKTNCTRSTTRLSHPWTTSVPASLRRSTTSVREVRNVQFPLFFNTHSLPPPPPPAPNLYHHHSRLSHVLLLRCFRKTTHLNITMLCRTKKIEDWLYKFHDKQICFSFIIKH
jgi:hypothetical protein